VGGRVREARAIRALSPLLHFYFLGVIRTVSFIQGNAMTMGYVGGTREDRSMCKCDATTKRRMKRVDDRDPAGLPVAQHKRVDGARNAKTKRRPMHDETGGGVPSSHPD
jgi:hypothetical protein